MKSDDFMLLKERRALRPHELSRVRKHVHKALREQWFVLYRAAGEPAFGNLKKPEVFDRDKIKYINDPRVCKIEYSTVIVIITFKK